MCLLHVLFRLRREYGLLLHAAHLNHHLRGEEADADARYVRKLSEWLGLEVTIGDADVRQYAERKQASIEEAAREVRYEFLARVALERGAEGIATGHTYDDHVETVLLHLLRGAGTAGMGGLEPVMEISSRATQHAGARIIRPLLEVDRAETLAYCKEHVLRPRIDSSNMSPSFLRNRIRMELLPILRRYNANIVDTLGRSARFAKEDERFITQRAQQLWPEVAQTKKDRVEIHVSALAQLPGALQSRLLRMAVARAAGSARDLQARHVDAIRSLLSKETGKQVCLPHGLLCRRSYETLHLLMWEKKNPCNVWPDTGISVSVPGETKLPGWRVSSEIDVVSASTTCHPYVAELDLKKAGHSLFVRKRRSGDRFQPLGMSSLKKLQDFMVDCKIPRWERDCVPLLCSEGWLLWVVGWRIDDRVKVTETTKEVLRITFHRS